MENINIAAILGDKPKGTKLYDKLRGRTVSFDKIGTQYGTTICATHGNSFFTYKPNGKYDVSTEDGIQILVPSKEMQDWSKFAWKKGDVLITGMGKFCIFGGWTNDDYTEFYAKFVSDKYGDNYTCKTLDWTKEYNEKVIKQYISNIEEIKGGKLNLDTLEIERKPEFKDGDIVVLRTLVFIFRGITDNGNIIGYPAVSKRTSYLYTEEIDGRILSCYKNDISQMRLATDSEKQQLFDALANIGKKWNPDTKQIEDLPKKCDLKAFDKVLVRDTKYEYWRPAFFASLDEDSINEYGYCLIGDPDGVFCKYCIPYNEETAHLLGTTDDWEN